MEYVSPTTHQRIATRSDGSHYLRRPVIFTALMSLPVTLSYVSWQAGGLPILTDLAFGLMSAIVFAALFYELANFHRFFSIAGPVFYGGVLVWFTQDYLQNWSLIGSAPEGIDFDSKIVAKSAFCHALLVASMSCGLLIPYGRPAEKLLSAVPEPPTRESVLWVIAIGGLFGLMPYEVFTREPIHLALYKEIFSGRGSGASFTTGRTGNVNVNFGGYIIEIINFGRMISILAAFYLVFMARSNLVRFLLLAYWLIWLGLGFGSGTRGQVATVGLPMVAFLFIRFQSQASLLMSRVSKRAWISAGIMVFLVLFLVQFQGVTRGQRLTPEQLFKTDLGELPLTELAGNDMFSTTLTGMAIIPQENGFFNNNFPGHGLIITLPNTIYKFVIGPIPRALWHGKPIDQLNVWYSDIVTGNTDGAAGTTISSGLVGYWYFRYGLAGIIQGGLLMGWLYGVAERTFQNARGRMMPLLFSTLLIVILFQCFRDFWEHHFYPPIIAMVLITLLIKGYQSLTGQPSAKSLLLQP